MIVIDGSRGEGGGQILRSALSLAAATAKPFVIERIRAGRDRPGLMRQHLTAVNAAAAICGARTEGAEVGSLRLAFAPGAVRAGDYVFPIGTAGSTMLVLQTVLPPLALAGAESRVTLTGGTHNQQAPAFEFLERAFLPMVRRMGLAAEVRLVRPGFYPAGGGEIQARIGPAGALAPLVIEERGRSVSRLGEALLANLPIHIARRELARLGERLGLEPRELILRVEKEAAGPGNCVLATLAYEQVAEVVTSVGRRGVSAEQVAEEAAAEALAWRDSGAPVGVHLADQLLLPMALGAGGRFVTVEPSSHTLTNMAVIRMFLDVPLDAVRLEDGRWLVTVGEGR